MKQYDAIVVGTGFAGAIIARRIAEELDKKVLVIEKRNHIGGNMYDYTDDYGIRIQKYGPHTFHTNNELVYKYLTNYCLFDEYLLKCEAIVKGTSTPTPFNFKTIDQIYTKEEAIALKEKLIIRYGSSQATVLELLNCEDKDIKGYAEYLFENDYSLYTAKQWGKKPTEIDSSILKRVPILFSYRDTYFNDVYQGIPQGGFTGIFEKMLAHQNINVELSTDVLDNIIVDEHKKSLIYKDVHIPVIYTGALDELFNYRYGKLPYRSLEFELEYLPVSSFQNVAIVAYPADKDITRITEYTKLPYQNIENKTVIAKEYSMQYDKEADKGNEPYYPILTYESMKQYNKYLELAEQYSNLILCGRLADFKYYNMDQVIERTLNVFDQKVIPLIKQ